MTDPIAKNHHPLFSRAAFWSFYKGAYAYDHQTGPNRALHMLGTILALWLLVACFTTLPIWWALAFPLVHALPGLLGHRLFERNHEIGDFRFAAGKYPNLWFIAANHIMTFEVLTYPLRALWRRIAPR
jgi:hypothetical protein